MLQILRQSNADLLREIDKLGEVLTHAAEALPPELDTYYLSVVEGCDDFRQQVKQNLRDLDLGQTSILPDVLSTTQEVTRWFQLFNRRLVSPVLRARPSDRLSLKVLCWLHSRHPQTRLIPAGLSDGEFGIWPAPPLPTVYFMHCSAQNGLLYLPLFFHEFGHLLYECHRAEMDDLVRSLQETIGLLLGPPVQRNDLHSKAEAERRNMIVEKWYLWAQELFCDAVGLAIGGPAFAHSFSFYLRLRGRSEYYIPPEHLVQRDHPVSWLRVHVLVDRSRQMGFDAEADLWESTWSAIAAAGDVREDYYGYYSPEFLRPVQEVIDHMLTEAAPCSYCDADPTEPEQAVHSPVPLLNQAWHMFFEDPRSYPVWEQSAIATMFAPDTATS